MALYAHALSPIFLERDTRATYRLWSLHLLAGLIVEVAHVRGDGAVVGPDNGGGEETRGRGTSACDATVGGLNARPLASRGCNEANMGGISKRCIMNRHHMLLEYNNLTLTHSEAK